MTKSARWAWVVATLVATGIALVLGFVISLTSDVRGMYENYFVWLFTLNVAVAGLLVVVIVLAAVRLWLRSRRGKFGSKLLLKLAGIFTLVGVVPGAMVYTVSYQFVSRSIEAWFDVQVEGALDAGLNLGRSTLEAQVSELANKTRIAAERLGDAREPPPALTLERLREQLAAKDVAILNATGQVIVTAGVSSLAIAPDAPSAALLRQARTTRVASRLEGLDDEPAAGTVPSARVRAVALVPARTIALANEDRYLMVVQEVPPMLAANALAVQAAYREYQQRALARDGLRKMYIGTLTLALVLAVFGAVLLAALLGNQLARPLLLLAQGVRQVAAGDLTAKPVFASRDELGGLTRSFADMTQQLSDAREQVQRGVTQLESARTYLQTILDNMTAGVIVFDPDLRIESVNPGATRILKAPLSAYIGRTLEEIPGLQSFADAVARRFDGHSDGGDATDRDTWQDAFELPLPAVGAREGDTLTLLVRGAALPYDSRLMVFDDISEVVSAQRSAAWSEVARRLAHEIKNPLTPIQLSAERMQHKLEAKLEGADQAMLQRSVATIVNQVQAMKQLVNEFRDYARLPAMRSQPLDLNALVAEVLGLYGLASEQGRLDAQLSPQLPRIHGDPTQLRQVVHNLVQNGLDSIGERPAGHVQVITEPVTNDQGECRAVRLRIVDNGPGFPDKVLKRAFEPYVTTKSKGTGLGLAVVKKIADEHGARVRIGNLAGAADGDAAPTGAQVSISFSNLVVQAAASAPAAGDHTPAG